MQTIGERLEEARKRKGISIREAAEATKVRGDYLQRFESNSFEIDLPPLYVRGFLRGYARFLALDPERLVQDYDAHLADQGKVVRRETREIYGRMELGEGAAGSPSERGETAEAAPEARRQTDQLMLLKYGLIAMTALVVVLVVFVIVKLLTSDSGPRARSPAHEPPAAAALKAGVENVLTIVATEPVRVKVIRIMDNSVLLDGMAALPAGQSKVFRYSDRLKVTVEDPRKIRLEINGQRLEVPIKTYGFFYVDPPGA